MEAGFDKLDSWLGRVDRRSPRTAPAVTDRDVTVVIQGPVSPVRSNIRDLIQSLRRLLPNGELVLSSWKGTLVGELDVDKVVLSTDPGEVKPRESGAKTNNVNRQTVSTFHGLQHATRPWCLKVRTDTVVQHTGFLRWPSVYSARATEGKLHRERIVTTTVYTRNPSRVDHRLHYHPSDCVQFGTTDDLGALWDAPPYRNEYEFLLGDRIVVSEQWVWMSRLARAGLGPSFDRPDVDRHAELCLVNNWLVVEPSAFGCSVPQLIPTARDRLSLYCHADWRRQYQRLCLGDRVSFSAQSSVRQAIARGWIERLHGTWPDVHVLPPEATPWPSRTVTSPDEVRS